MKIASASGAKARRQRGAVAIVFGLSIFVLFGSLALVIDLGRTYLVRTELQNAADAAALAGAKELNKTLAGVNNAVSRAIGIAAQNKFNFSTTVTITNANLWVGSCPDDVCMVPVSNVDTAAEAADKTFLKVDIPSGSLATFIAGVPTTVAGTGKPFTATFGRAVAGRFLTNVTPIGVCAIDPATKGGRRAVGGGLPDELTEYGFRRGIGYNTFELGSISGGSSDTYLLDPIGSHSSPCVPSNANNVNTAQFVCTGSSATITAVPTLVWGNTGIQATPTERALNSRLGVNPPAQCNSLSAPPDVNIRIYPCSSSGAGCQNITPPNAAAYPNTWMDPDSTTVPNARSVSGLPAQTIDLSKFSSGTATKDDYGVLWSYSRAVKASGSAPNATAGDPFTPADWQYLYSTPQLRAEASYPGGSTGTSGSPYSQTTGPYFRSGGAGAVPKRRVLNLAIVDCSTPIGNGSCLSIPVVAIGRFFMQVEARIAGSDRKLEVEFDGLVDPLPDSVVKLYR